jgi:hypothetical protein
MICIVFYYLGQQIIDNLNWIVNPPLSNVPRHVRFDKKVEMFFLNLYDDEESLKSAYVSILKKNDNVDQIDLLDPERDENEFAKLQKFLIKYGQPGDVKVLRLPAILRPK